MSNVARVATRKEIIHYWIKKKNATRALRSVLFILFKVTNILYYYIMGEVNPN